MPEGRSGKKNNLRLPLDFNRCRVLRSEQAFDSLRPPLRTSVARDDIEDVAMLILGVDEGPCAFGIEVVARAAVDNGVGDGVVVEARRGAAHAELRFVNVLRGCGIDGPVEAKNIARTVELQALGFGRGGWRPWPAPACPKSC